MNHHGRHPDNPSCVITCAYYDGEGERHDISLEQISDVLQRPDGFVWVGLYEPQESVLHKLQDEFGLHDLAIEDALKAHQRPKAESYGNSLFVVVNTAQLVNERIRYGETHAFLGARFLLTVRHGASLSYTPVRHRVEREPAMLRMGASFCLYGVLDFVVDNYLPIMDEFRDTLEGLEKTSLPTTTSAKPWCACTSSSANSTRCGWWWHRCRTCSRTSSATRAR